MQNPMLHDLGTAWLSADTWNHLGMILGGALVTVFATLSGYLVYLFKRLVKRLESQSDRPIELSFQDAVDINIQLDRARVKFNAMRVHLNRYHNTGRYLDGGQIITCTRTHERVRPGIGYQAEVFNQLLATTVPHELELVMEQGPAWRAAMDLPDCKFRWLVEAGGANAVARCGVYVAGELVGFVGADFNTVPIESPACITELCGYAREIGKILANYQK